MDEHKAQPSTVHAYCPKTVADLLKRWTELPDARLFSGGTSFFRSHRGPKLRLSDDIIVLNGIEELTRISRTERFIEIGAVTNISVLLTLRKILPAAFIETLEKISAAQRRSLETLGGSIADRAQLLLPAPLAALEAVYELRSAEDASARSCGAQKYFAERHSADRAEKKEGAPNRELLTRIRLPLEGWDLSLTQYFPEEELRKEGQAETQKSFFGMGVFLARVQNSMLTDLRCVFSGGRRSAGEIDSADEATLLRDKNYEMFFSGRHLPLDKKECAAFLQRWKAEAANLPAPDPYTKDRFFSFLSSALERLSE